MKDYYFLAGPLALGGRLRRLSDQINAELAQLNHSYEVSLDQRWLPVFFMLAHNEQAIITELAKSIGQTHASVSQIVREMNAAGVITSTPSSDDGRVHLVSLNKKGRQIAQQASTQWQDINAAMENLFNDCNIDFWSAIDAMEYALNDADIGSRVKGARQQRINQQLEIQAYSAAYKKTFRQLNSEWAKEPANNSTHQRVLERPKKTIINKGGYISIARLKGEAVGTCALVITGRNEATLQYLTVSPGHRRQGIGEQLVQHCIEAARHRKIKKLTLLSQTGNTALIDLARKLGFRQTATPTTKNPKDHLSLSLKLSLGL